MMTKTIVASAAALFAASSFAAVHAQGTIKCAGTNACKGQGWTPVKNNLECTVKSGKIVL